MRECERCGFKKSVDRFEVDNGKIGVDLYCNVCKKCRLELGEKWIEKFGVEG